ncbi:hypothetical protein [Neptunomonas qingdaonensis]|uniref:Uncharacterized protein n=1 Tax=Neptunomonas qingdaonensis TaxID=1045558 RepID=A0A1I2SGV5_9GAMM|nr:hypothetical protein [Neptunomonas qingdaonensis]SFG52024.1 hypothetical protein SAMN05216175_1088 [Neptunomonas qingdaonensis]
MNKYCTYSIRRFYELFISRRFDQNDVALFIVLARDYSKKGSVIRELGDFLAHPQQKDRGIVINSINKLMLEFEEYLEDDYRLPQGLPESVPRFEGIGGDDEIIRDLSLIFESFGIKKLDINKNNKSYRELVFCLIFLLGNFKIKYRDTILDLEISYSSSLALKAQCMSTKFINHYAQVTIIAVPNIWRRSDSSRLNGHILDGYIVRRFKEGFLGAIKYEQALSLDTPSIKDFGRGEVWPMDGK